MGRFGICPEVELGDAEAVVGLAVPLLMHSVRFGSVACCYVLRVTQRREKRPINGRCAGIVTPHAL